MRYLPGINPTIANESISSYHLITHLINDPDLIPTAFSLFNEVESPITDLLNQKGLKTKGLREGIMNANYRVVGSNHVQYALKNSDTRKLRFKATSAGVTYSTGSAAVTTILASVAFFIHLDSNWAGTKEVLELNDNQTQLYIINEDVPTEVESGIWRYEVRLKTNDPDAVVNTDLFVEGSECACVQTNYEHDFSESGVEKYVFNGWGHSYMSLQRIKYSYSGTAAAMKMSKKWTIHNGIKTFITEAEEQMLKRAAKYNEYNLVFGKGTVTEDGTVFLHDKRGREILAGDGFMNQQDGAYEFSYNEWTLRFIESVMQDVDLRVGVNGITECSLFCGQSAMAGFMKLMRTLGVTSDNNVEGTGSAKGINDSYSYYEFNGVRIIPRRWRWLDGTERATKYLSDGTRKSAWDGFFVPLGKTEGGDNQIEMVQLRKPTMGTVSGIDKGGEMASSVDGSSVHLLFQNGVISRAKITRIFRPYDA